MKKEMKEQVQIIKALDFETLVELADMFEDYENEHKLSEELKAFDLCLHTALRDRCLELIEEEKKLKAIIGTREEIAEEDREYTNSMDAVEFLEEATKDKFFKVEMLIKIAKYFADTAIKNKIELEEMYAVEFYVEDESGLYLVLQNEYDVDLNSPIRIA